MSLSAFVPIVIRSPTSVTVHGRAIPEHQEMPLVSPDDTETNRVLNSERIMPALASYCEPASLLSPALITADIACEVVGSRGYRSATAMTAAIRARGCIQSAHDGISDTGSRRSSPCWFQNRRTMSIPLYLHSHSAGLRRVLRDCRDSTTTQSGNSGAAMTQAAPRPRNNVACSTKQSRLPSGSAQ
jgi:hypothetical protein